MTNIEKIKAKAMTSEKLAEFFLLNMVGFYRLHCEECDYYNFCDEVCGACELGMSEAMSGCVSIIKHWLESEAEENESR